jgi:membrane protease YdiL (CAAX protease family)
LPGIFRPGATRREWFLRPLIVGVIGGVILVIVDLLITRYSDFGGFPHPAFPGSILASLTAGIGEEILFRLFMLSLWAVLLSWLLGKLFDKKNSRPWALWAANIIAALAFAAGHLSSAMYFFGVSTPVELPVQVILMIFALNGFVGILAGWLFITEGLIAAAGVHFWADIVWHVIYGLLK